MSQLLTALRQLAPRRRPLLYSAAAVTSIGGAYLAPRLLATPPPQLTATTRPRSTMATPYKTTPYTPPPTLLTTPQDPADFARQDEAPDTTFYAHPRFVTHIDDAAIAALRAYYATVLPTGPPSPTTPPPRILDVCTSWVSHYPAAVEAAACAGAVRVTGLGLNGAELARNALLAGGGRVVRDLNAAPGVDGAALGLGAGEAFEALTCAVSVDYLTAPVEVLARLRRVTRVGGRVHLAVSNRCFPSKAVRRWLYAGEDARLRFCCEDLYRAGWRDVEVVLVTDGGGEGERAGGASGIGRLMASMGLGMGGDPLWVVRGTNTGVP